MPKVKFLADKVYELEVKYIADFAYGPDDTCAFCQGDPCAERSEPDSPIAVYMETFKSEETCPFCQGRPS